MRNSEYTIYIRTRNSTQSFRKERDGWVQTSSRGVRRPCTPEQVLSHVLPILVEGQQRASISVVPDKPVP